MIVVRRRTVSLVAAACLLLSSFTPAAFAAPGSGTSDPRDLKFARMLAADGVSALEGVSDTADDTPATAVALDDSQTGSLDIAGDLIDVYSVTLTAGDRFGAVLLGDGVLNADAYLYGPGIVDPASTPALAGSIGDAFEKSLTYDVVADGTYYVAVTPAAGAGAYTLNAYWYPWADEADNEIGMLNGISSPLTDALSAVADPDDVHSVTIAAGQRLTMTLTPAAGLNADLFLYAPDADSIGSAVPIAGSAGAGTGGVETFVYDVPAGSDATGTYWFDARAVSGSGAYTVTWTVSALPADAWDDAGDAVAIAPGSRMASLDESTDVNDLYSIGLASGQTISLTLDGPAGADFDIYVYGPVPVDVVNDEPVAFRADGVSDETLTFDCTQTGTYYIEIRSFSGSGSYSLTTAVATTPVFTAANRLSGSNRYATAIDASKKSFADGSCRTVVLATGQNFPDALSASALAGVYESPVLLTMQNMLPAGLIDEFRRLGATKVVIIGGAPAIGDGVALAIKNAGFSTQRISGNDRYLTSAAVAREVRRLTGARDDLTAFLVRGDAYADAVAVGPFAYANAFPVLLTRTDALVPSTRAVMTEIGVKQVVIAGSEAAVNADVFAAAQGTTGVLSVHREGGRDRYDTAGRIAAYCVSMWWGENASIGLATGADFPDALAGGATMGASRGVLLLTRPDLLSAPTAAYLDDAAGQTISLKVLGGTPALSAKVLADAQAIVGANR